MSLKYPISNRNRLLQFFNTNKIQKTSNDIINYLLYRREDLKLTDTEIQMLYHKWYDKTCLGHFFSVMSNGEDYDESKKCECTY